MKILIAYDGSEGANKAIRGLSRAGLPTREVEALVVSVAEVWLPPPAGEHDDTFPLQVPHGLKRSREHAARIMSEAEGKAAQGQKLIREVFPDWNVNREVMSGSPAFEILNRTSAWKPQLVVVGSDGHTAIGRFVLGSVSQKVLTEAECSVRIGREPTGVGESAQRVIVGVDGSAGSQTAIRAVAHRDWLPGSEVRVVVAQDRITAFPASLLIAPVKEFVNETNEEERTEADEMIAKAVKTLRATLNERVTVSSLIESGDPKQVLVRQAQDFGADCIFTGATGFSNRIERFVLGSVSAAVAARAHCSVEVVRG